VACLFIYPTKPEQSALIAKAFFTAFPKIDYKESGIPKTLDDFMAVKKPKVKRTPKSTKAKKSAKLREDQDGMELDSPKEPTKTPKQDQKTGMLEAKIEEIQRNQRQYQLQMQEISNQLGSVIGYLSKKADGALQAKAGPPEHHSKHRYKPKYSRLKTIRYKPKFQRSQLPRMSSNQRQCKCH